jgi:hypothetical protein
MNRDSSTKREISWVCMVSLKREGDFDVRCFNGEEEMR